jgi:hypothetical protein
MLHILRPALLGITLLSGASAAMAIEEARYTVIKQDGMFELRDYAPHIVAETQVDSTLEEAGNTAFQALFGYISGQNAPRSKIAMTAPVSQQASGERIAMTAPVSQQASGERIAMTVPVSQQGQSGQWAVSFTMPARYTLSSLPEPTNPRVVLRERPAQRMAVVRYSGRWTQANYEQHQQRLQQWLAQQGLQVSGAPVWARYNAPFTPWFMRRNEILLPLSTGS